MPRLLLTAATVGMFLFALAGRAGMFAGTHIVTFAQARELTALEREAGWYRVENVTLDLDRAVSFEQGGPTSVEHKRITWVPVTGADGFHVRFVKDLRYGEEKAGPPGPTLTVIGHFTLDLNELNQMRKVLFTKVIETADPARRKALENQGPVAVIPLPAGVLGYENRKYYSDLAWKYESSVNSGLILLGLAMLTWGYWMVDRFIVRRELRSSPGVAKGTCERCGATTTVWPFEVAFTTLRKILVNPYAYKGRYRIYPETETAVQEYCRACYVRIRSRLHTAGWLRALLIILAPGIPLYWLVTPVIGSLCFEYLTKEVGNGAAVGGGLLAGIAWFTVPLVWLPLFFRALHRFALGGRLHDEVTAGLPSWRVLGMFDRGKIKLERDTRL